MLAAGCAAASPASIATAAVGVVAGPTRPISLCQRGKASRAANLTDMEIAVAWVAKATSVATSDRLFDPFTRPMAAAQMALQPKAAPRSLVASRLSTQAIRLHHHRPRLWLIACGGRAGVSGRQHFYRALCQPAIRCAPYLPVRLLS